MDVNQTKPIHIKCPKCGYDVSYASNHIQREYELAKERHSYLLRQIRALKQVSGYKNNPKYKRAAIDFESNKQRLETLNRARKNIAKESELQKWLIFKRYVEQEIGKEKTLKFIKEAEDDLLYNDYETAIQKFNNFNGV